MPNLALMRIAAHHRKAGDTVELRQCRSSVEPFMWDHFDKVYASAIFTKTLPLAKRLSEVYPDAIIGGTGVDLGKLAEARTTLERLGITQRQPDYSDYPAFRSSIGFTQRGCRLNCSFCDVRKKEGKVKADQGIWNIWRGEPWPREIMLLDNDFFGEPSWTERIEEMKAGRFKVCFTQGFNVRLINDEQAAAIASVRYSDDQFKRKMLYTAWDNRKDGDLLFRNLNSLVRYGVKPDEIMVYILIGYDHDKRCALSYVTEDDLYRHARLREFGCRPYPMPFVRNKELLGFQRWIIRRIDLMGVDWQMFARADYQPKNL